MLKIQFLVVLLFFNCAMSLDADTDWPSSRLKWPRLPNIQDLLKIQQQPRIALQEVINNSEKFPIEFPINTTRLLHLKQNKSEENLEKFVNSAYPVLHEYSLRLYMSFLYQKQRFGSKIERELYQNMTLNDLIDRLLSKRAVSFSGIEDKYLLLDGTKGEGGFEKIGTPDESGLLILQNCLSYDEIKLSAHLGISSETYFINDGKRENLGIAEDQNKVEDDGVIIQITGPRLDKELVMEYREIVKSKKQNTHIYGYGQSFLPTMQGIFISFYGAVSFTYQELEWHKTFDSDNFIKIGEDQYFDKGVYEKRINLSVDTLLIEANKRAGDVKKYAFVYVSDFGLEKWKIIPEQEKLFLDTFAKRISFLGKRLKNISDVYFANFHEKLLVDKIPIEDHPLGKIAVRAGSREPHEKLSGADSGKLLVVSYPGNGNAFPGNEFWLDQLSASGAAAAACSSQVGELHNPLVNPNVRAARLRVVTVEGLFGVEEYLKLVGKEKQ